MELALWLIGIHVVELMGVAIFLLIRKNRILENTVASQQQYINSVSFLLSETSNSLKSITDNLWVEDDENVKQAMENLKEIQTILKDFNS